MLLAPSQELQIPKSSDPSNEADWLSEDDLDSGKPWNEASYVYGIVGVRRTGKDVYAANLARYQHNRNGKRILHNGGINDPGDFCQHRPRCKDAVSTLDVLDLAQDPSRLVKLLSDSVVVITEAHNYFDPYRQMSGFQARVRNVIMQIGKFESSLIWTTQYPERVSGALIQQTDWGIRVSATKRSWKEEGVRCPGWGPKNHRNWKEHQDCKKRGTYNGRKPHRYDIFAAWVMQRNHPHWRRNVPQVKRRVLQCAQRFYKYNVTEATVDHTMIQGLNSDELKRRDRAAMLDVVSDALQRMKFGGLVDPEKNTPIQYDDVVTEIEIIRAVQAINPEASVDPRQLREALISLDLQRHAKNSGRRLYKLGEWTP